MLQAKMTVTDEIAQLTKWKVIINVLVNISQAFIK
jgi:hypothetical protein